MKTRNCFVIAAGALALVVAAPQVKAGGNDGCCTSGCSHMGVTASPRVQEMIEDRCKSQCVAPTQVTTFTITRQTEVAASPRVQQMRTERAAAQTGALTTETAGYRATGSDGITASPRLRSQLDERRQVIEIAPLK
jgi:hypothetical protein